MTEKMEPCCARWHARISASKHDLAVVARKAARASIRNRNIDLFKAQIVELKAIIASHKQGLEDHEAEHARAYLKDLEDRGIIEPEGFELSDDPAVQARQILESAAHFEEQV